MSIAILILFAYLLIGFVFAFGFVFALLCFCVRFALGGRGGYPLAAGLQRAAAPHR